MKVQPKSLVRDYGTSDPSILRRVVVVAPRTPRAIASASQYRAAVCKATGLYLDYRLAEPLWREVPVCPSDAARIGSWLAYWDASQPRPEVVGSGLNDAPIHVARAWALGIPAERYPIGCGCLLPHRWRGGRRRILATLRYSRRLRADQWCGIPQKLRTADLRRLAKLPGWACRAIAGARFELWWDAPARRIRWEWVAHLLRQLSPERRAQLQEDLLPASRWANFLAPHAYSLWADRSFLAHALKYQLCGAVPRDSQRLTQLNQDCETEEERALRRDESEQAAEELDRYLRRRNRRVSWQVWGHTATLELDSSGRPTLVHYRGRRTDVSAINDVSQIVGHSWCVQRDLSVELDHDAGW